MSRTIRNRANKLAELTSSELLERARARKAKSAKINAEMRDFADYLNDDSVDDFDCSEILQCRAISAFNQRTF